MTNQNPIWCLENVLYISVIHHQAHQKESAESHFSDNVFDDVCKKGNTLLWDLVQEENSVSFDCL